MNVPDVERTEAVPASEMDAFQAVIAALNPLEREARRRVLMSAATMLREEDAVRGIHATRVATGNGNTALPSKRTVPFSENLTMPVSEFLVEKQPRTGTETLVCLAFYLVHYKSQEQFGIGHLRFLGSQVSDAVASFPLGDVNKARRLGYLKVSLGRESLELAPLGERLVLALPDRNAVAVVTGASVNEDRPKRPRGVRSA